MAEKRGGARPGAGRPAKVKIYADPIAAAEKQIAARLPDLIERLFELADGIQVRERDTKGGEKIYDRPPCFKSLSYLIDRVAGKPKQSVEAEVSGASGGPILVREVTVEMPDCDADDDEPEPVESQ